LQVLNSKDRVDTVDWAEIWKNSKERAIAQEELTQMKKESGTLFSLSLLSHLSSRNRFGMGVQLLITKNSLIVRISCDFRAIWYIGQTIHFGLGKPPLSARISREIGVKMEVARFREIENIVFCVVEASLLSSYLFYLPISSIFLSLLSSYLFYLTISSIFLFWFIYFIYIFLFFLLYIFDKRSYQWFIGIIIFMVGLAVLVGLFFKWKRWL
jgi:hypothetical protein